MSTPIDAPQTRDADNWAKPLDKLQTADIPAGALNLNVDGKALTGPIRGFGQMWQKTYRVRPFAGWVASSSGRRDARSI